MDQKDEYDVDEMDRIRSVNQPEEIYDCFVQAKQLETIVFAFERLKASIGVEKDAYDKIFPSLKKHLTSWKCSSLWKLLDVRASQKEYKKGGDCNSLRVLIIGGGPVGLRAAIECRMLGCKVMVMDKRTRITRNNVLHLWPFTIEDLKQLGAKKFYGKFCAGAIDHISIRSLQTILLKISLIVGIQYHMGVTYKDIREPQDSTEGWSIIMEPHDHPVAMVTFNAIIGCEGTKYCLKGFDRKEFRGKLALAITANFVNHNTEEEAAVEEISGVAFIFNQKFFKDLKAEMDIELENIVYYKDDTHYFVMTAKKDSLLRKEVLLKDYSTSQELLSRNNVNLFQLQQYALDAAHFSTDLPELEFALGNQGQPDVALFDFTSLFAAEHSSRIIRRHGKSLLLMLAGDSLLEPFWPTGTGLARGFLGAVDAAWMIREYSKNKPPLQLLSERESVYQLLSQTTPDKLCRDIKAYTIEPSSRYQRLNLRTFGPQQVLHLFDDIKTKRLSLKRSVANQNAANVVEQQNIKKSKQEEDTLMEDDDIKADDNEGILNSSITEGAVTRALYGDEQGLIKDPDELLSWLQHAVLDYNLKVVNFTDSWSNGMSLAALIHRYHPELIDYYSLKPANAVENNKLCFSIGEKHLGISSPLNPYEMKHPDKLALFSYLSFFYDIFHDKDPVSFHSNSKPLESPPPVMPSSPPSRSWNTKMTLARPVTKETADVKLKRAVTPRAMSPRPHSVFSGGPADGSDICYFCQKKVYLMERQSAQGIFFHRSCFRCYHCKSQLKTGNYSYSHGSDGEKGRFYCTPHFKQLFLSNPEAINYGRHKDGPSTPRKMSPNPPPLSQQASEDQRKIQQDQRKLQQDHRNKQFDQKMSEMKAAEPIQAPAKGRGKISDRIRNWESGNAAPVDTTPPSIHDNSRILGPPIEDGHHNNKTQVVERQLVHNNEVNTNKQDVSKPEISKQDVNKQEISKQDVSKPEISKQDVSKQEISKQDVSKQEISKHDVRKRDDVEVFHKDNITATNLHDNSDEHSEDDEVLPLPNITNVQRRHPTPQRGHSEQVHPTPEQGHPTPEQGHSTPEQGHPTPEQGHPTPEQGPHIIQRGHSAPHQSSEQDDEFEEATHRRSSRVISRDRLKLSKKHQTTMELSSNQEVSTRRTTRMTRMRSIGDPTRRGMGQKSIFRKRDSDYQLTDSKLQEHRKHYSRLLRAQEAQREMSQLEQQYDDLEEVGRQIEQKLRQADPSTDDISSTQMMRQFLSLINERNALIRRINELSLSIKELSLEDKQYEIDGRLEEFNMIHDDEMTEVQKRQYEQLIQEKLDVVDERDQLVQQLEEDRLKEREEDEIHSTMMDNKFGGNEPFDARKKSPTPPPPGPPMNTKGSMNTNRNAPKKKKSKSKLIVK